MSGKTLLELFPGQNGWDIRLFLFCSVFCSVAKSCLTFGEAVDCSTPGLPVLHHLPELAQTHVHWVGDAIQPFHPQSSPSPPAFNLSQYQGLFQWIGSSYQVAKVLELQLQHQSFQWISEYSGLTSFRIDSFDLLAVQGTLKSHLQQFKSINSSVLSFLYRPTLTSYMTTGKIIAVTIQTFIGKVMSLLFNKLPRLVIAFLPRRKHLLI